MTDYEAKDPNACKKLVELINQALPDADADILVENLEIIGSPSIVWYLNIDIVISKAGVLSVNRSRIVDETTKYFSEKQNAAETLAAGAGYRFTIEVSGGDTINLSYSVTDGTIYKLRISEVI